MTKELPIRQRKFGLTTFIIQLIMLILFFAYTDYDSEAKPESYPVGLSAGEQTNQTDHRWGRPQLALNGPVSKMNLINSQVDNQMTEHGTMFQDTFFFVVSAFSMAYCFASKHNFWSVAGGILLTAISAQWGILCKGFFYSTTHTISINILSMLGGTGSACIMFITWGAVLGQLSPLQLVVMIILEVPLALGTEWLAVKVLQTKDVGGSMLCHEFGAYFGVAVAIAMYRKETADNTNLSPSPLAAYRCLIGTMLFWIFWPTAIATPLVGPERYRVYINIYLSMLASCVTTFSLSSLLAKDGKMDLSHIQNATIAGGVAVGTAAETMLGPGGALLTGTLGAVLTILGMNYLQPLLTSKLHIYDTAGVHNLHGLVGILGGIVGALATGIATEDVYGPRLYEIFPAMTPRENTSAFRYLQELLPHLEPGAGRSPAEQAGFQMATVVMCFVVPVIGGILTGFILRAPFFEGPRSVDFYLDTPYLKIPTSEDEAKEESSIHSATRPSSAVDPSAKSNTVVPM